MVGWARRRNPGDDRGGKSKNELSVEKELVRRYFHEILDQGKVELVEEIFHPQCVMHRPGGTVVGIDSVRGVALDAEKRFWSLQHKYMTSLDRGIGWWSASLIAALEAASGVLV